MNIWILDGSKGIELLKKNFLDLPVKDDLVSGLLTALNQFTMVEFEEPIDSINMGGYIWVYLLEPEFDLLFVAADTKATEPETLRSRLTFVKDLFIRTYVKDKEHWKNTWIGDVEIFKPFEIELEKYYNNWQAAENIDLFADFFDVIGIIQQILSFLTNVVKNQIDFKRRERLEEKIESFFENFRNRMDVKKVKEFEKITYSPDSGFNIITINPTNCDIAVVKKQLKNLLSNVVHIIKKELGHDLSLNYFSEEKIFNFIFKNIGLLKRVNLEDFLLQLFLIS